MVSIIIPVLNEAAHIGRTVTHLRAQATADLLEIIVVDAGSSDDTVLMAESAGAIVLHCPICSRAAQMNYGAQHSRGEILYFVHADTLPPERYMAHFMSPIAAGAAMGCFRYRFDSDKWILRVNAWFTRLPFMFCQGGDKTFFIARKLFFELGAYDEQQVIMEEYDFLRRAKAAGYRLSILPFDCLVSARKYEQSSWLRVQWANFLVFNAWSWGVMEPVRLKQLYRKTLQGF